MPKYNQLLLDRYNDVAFLIRQVTKQHQNFYDALNYSTNHPNMAKWYYIKTKWRNFLSHLWIYVWPKRKLRCQVTLKEYGYSNGKPKLTAILYRKQSLNI